MTEALLQAKDICVSRGELTLIENKSFTISAGMLFQLQGDNGSGKTTLLRAMCSLIPLDKGEISWRGKLLPAAREDYFAEMCFAGHADGLKGDLTAIENLQCTLTDHTATRAECEYALEETGFTGRSDLACKVLSAGQRRRVVLARVLLSKAVLWILDEPLTALDAHGRALVGGLIEQHVSAGGSVVYSTHQALEISSHPVQTLALTS